MDQLSSITIWVDIFKVDGGDSVESSILQHAASQAPVLGVRAELQDLVIIIASAIIVVATCEVEGVVHPGHTHTGHGAGQEASSQAPGAGPRDQQLRGVQTVTITIP